MNDRKRKVNGAFWRKVIACIVGIAILVCISGTYKNYRIREGKAPYLTIKEFLPQLQVFGEITGENIYEEIVNDTEQMEQEYITVKTVRKVVSMFPKVEVSVLETYKKEDWYIGLSDWNLILSGIVEQYGNEHFFQANVTFLGDENSIISAAGDTLSDSQILTDRGIMEAVYWNTDDYLYSRVQVVCYREQILSVMGYSDEAAELSNVYLVDVSDTEVHFFMDDYHIRYGMSGENANIPDSISEKNGKELIAGSVVDLEFEQGKVIVDTKEAQMVHGKLLQVSATGIEIEGYGIYLPSENMKVYRLYGELASMSPRDLRIGYSFTDFVIENGQVAACLMIKEEDMESIRVLLKATDYATIYHETFQAVCNQDYEVISFENGIETGREEKSAGESLVIEDEMLNTGTKRIKLQPKVLSAKTILKSIERSQGNPVYKGTIEITGSEEGLLLVNEVLLEDYLCTVVPSEMPASYPKEALMTQAICARTYAYGKMIKPGIPEWGAHVDDSTGFQVYNNIVEHSSTTEAVKATHNKVAVYNGEPIGTYYYSTSGGVGTDISIWHGSGEIPAYLSAKMIGEDTMNPEALMEESVFREWIQKKNTAHFEAEEGWYRWTYTVEKVDAETMCAVLQRRYENNPNLILTKNADGEFVSQPVTKLGIIKNIEIEKRLLGGVADEMVITGSKAVVKVISELNIRYVLADGVTKVVRQSGDEVNASSSIPSAYMIIDLEKEEDEVTGYTITGGGFGHGVGMSQNGAKNMAQRGMSSEEIIGFFYPGVELKTLQFGE